MEELGERETRHFSFWSFLHHPGYRRREQTRNPVWRAVEEPVERAIDFGVRYDIQGAVREEWDGETGERG